SDVHKSRAEGMRIQDEISNLHSVSACSEPPNHLQQEVGVNDAVSIYNQYRIKALVKQNPESKLQCESLSQPRSICTHQDASTGDARKISGSVGTIVGDDNYLGLEQVGWRAPRNAVNASDNPGSFIVRRNYYCEFSDVRD